MNIEDEDKPIPGYIWDDISVVDSPFGFRGWHFSKSLAEEAIAEHCGHAFGHFRYLAEITDNEFTRIFVWAVKNYTYARDGSSKVLCLGMRVPQFIGSGGHGDEYDSLGLAFRAFLDADHGLHLLQTGNVDRWLRVREQEDDAREKLERGERGMAWRADRARQAAREMWGKPRHPLKSRLFQMPLDC